MSLTGAIQGCGHRFCQFCLKAYVHIQLREGAYPIMCPEPDCSVELGPTQCEGLQLSGAEAAKMLKVLIQLIQADEECTAHACVCDAAG